MRHLWCNKPFNADILWKPGLSSFKTSSQTLAACLAEMSWLMTYRFRRMVLRCASEGRCTLGIWVSSFRLSFSRFWQYFTVPPPQALESTGFHGFHGTLWTSIDSENATSKKFEVDFWVYGCLQNPVDSMEFHGIHWTSINTELKLTLLSLQYSSRYSHK